MRTNSVISDPEPLVPVPPVQPDKKKEPQNDFEKLANSSNYKQVKDYLDQRIKYFQQYLPSSGKPVEELTDEQRAVAWGQASVAIKELEMIKSTLDNLKRKN